MRNVLVSPRGIKKSREGIFELAHMILRDQCPPDNRMYLCTLGESEECNCIECWDKYLFWAVNGYKGDPYSSDRLRDTNW